MPGEVWDGHQEEFLLWKSGQALELATQGVGEVTIPGGVEEMIGHGTECCGCIGIVMFSQRLGSMILEIFSSLMEFMIL